MSLFFVQRHIKNLKEKLKELNLTTDKLQLVSQKIEALATNKVNSVCWAEVRLKHTSEVMVNLGGGYFLETTKESALGIAQRRKDYIKENIRKLEKIKEGLEKKQGITRGKGFEKRVIEKNQDGEDVFEIMEFPGEMDENQTAIQQQEEEIKEVKEEKPAKKFVKHSFHQNSQPSKLHNSEPPKPIVQAPPSAPKRVSKFKQQRQQQRKL